VAIELNWTYISLDGVVEGPHLWPSPGRPSDERADQIQTDLALSCDALLMGRHTYDNFAPRVADAPAPPSPTTSTRWRSTSCRRR
jgi:dihydrofolate reductase